jgi:hypothetical protein
VYKCATVAWAKPSMVVGVRRDPRFDDLAEVTMKAWILLLALLVPAYSNAGKLDLTQDLGGLDLAVTLVPPDNPNAIRIANQTEKVVTCKGRLTGADAGRVSTIAVQPGKSGTMPLPSNRRDMVRSAELKCAEKAAAKK